MALSSEFYFVSALDARNKSGTAPKKSVRTSISVAPAFRPGFEYDDVFVVSNKLVNRNVFSYNAR